MDFRYFLGHEASMLDIDDPLSEYPALSHCSLCGRQARCFRIAVDETGQVTGYAGFCFESKETANNLSVIMGNPEVPSEPEFFYRGCMDCLRLGLFTVSHVTEVGDIKNGKLTPEDYRPGFPKEAVSELSRTPSFSTFQDAIWLSHCNDFMAYIGEWGPEDFSRNAPDADAEKLFAEVEQVEPLEKWAHLRGYGFYVFRCLHCGKLRAFSDCD